MIKHDLEHILCYLKIIQGKLSEKFLNRIEGENGYLDVRLLGEIKEISKIAALFSKNECNKDKASAVEETSFNMFFEKFDNLRNTLVILALLNTVFTIILMIIFMF